MSNKKQKTFKRCVDEIEEEVEAHACKIERLKDEIVRLKPYYRITISHRRSGKAVHTHWQLFLMRRDAENIANELSHLFEVFSFKVEVKTEPTTHISARDLTAFYDHAPQTAQQVFDEWKKRFWE